MFGFLYGGYVLVVWISVFLFLVWGLSLNLGGFALDGCFCRCLDLILIAVAWCGIVAW